MQNVRGGFAPRRTRFISRERCTFARLTEHESEHPQGSNDEEVRSREGSPRVHQPQLIALLMSMAYHDNNGVAVRQRPTPRQNAEGNFRRQGVR